MKNVIQEAGKKLQTGTKSRMSNIANFRLGDAGKRPLIYVDDWKKIGQLVDEILPNWKKKFCIEDVYFMRYQHGMQKNEDISFENQAKISLPDKNRLWFELERMNVNCSTKVDGVIQVSKDIILTLEFRNPSKID